MSAAIQLADVTAFLYRECRLLDDEQWDDWLTCYHPEARFWMPCWDDDGTLVTRSEEHTSELQSH